VGRRLAHRDVKPANLLVRDGRMLLIDVAFVQAHPSPWRQAVDLANMMLCLALRSDPELVYARPCASSRSRRSPRRSRPPAG
jgi:tRNA A-37 threonylcarbamoyl transferase component Bud32